MSYSNQEMSTDPVTCESDREAVAPVYANTQARVFNLNISLKVYRCQRYGGITFIVAWAKLRLSRYIYGSEQTWM